MSEDGLCEKFVSMISIKGRSEKDIAALSGLTHKFPKVIQTFSHEDLLKITEFYKPHLAYVIEYDITSILQNLATKNILTNDEAKRFKAKEEREGRAGVESFISDIMKMDSVVLVSLWEALAEELVRFPSPNMTRILKEVTEGGPDLLMNIQASLQPTPIDARIKGLHDTHRGGVSESTRTLEDQASVGDPCTRAVGFETRYTELMVFKQFKRTYSERLHELEKTGRTHAELIEERTKEKCERIWTEQLFSKNPGSETDPHIIVVSGVAGIGKTTMVQKIMFDWARGTQYQRFAFVFMFKFRELNLLHTETEPQMFLTRLIVRHYKYLNDPRLTEILKKPESLLFIIDGLDEFKHKLDFTQEKLCSNPDDYFPVHTLVTSLVRRTLLKGCTVLITTRPTALETLDMERVDRFAEILGFFPEQRLMYFKKFFGDADQGSEAFQYVEENAILYTMCFNPSYCWIICSVLKSHFMTPEEERGAAPRTVTELFVMFLHNILTKHKREANDQREILVKLGKMAYYGVVNKTLVFYDKMEMSTFGLQPVLSSPFISGFLKEILQRESTLEHTTYTFYHLTIQEFMAACSFYLSSSGGIEELLEKLDSCEDGRFEILTRFLAGLARYSVFKTLEEVMGEFERKTAKQILEWVKKKAEEALRGRDKSEALRVCQWLYETQNKRLIRDTIGKDLKMDFRRTTLSPLDCAVLGSVISCCGELEELNLSETNLTPECMMRLAPGLICCRRVNLRYCDLTSTYCSALSSALSAPHSRLTELDLWKNKNMEDSGVNQLCEGLRSENCKLEKLNLSECHLTSRCSSALSSALSSPHSQLTELNLSNNNMEDLGVDQLCERLRSENCKLEKLNLSHCGLTSRCCSALSSSLSAPHSRLTELDLSNNNMVDSGVDQLFEGLRSENCKLKKLNLWSCHLTSRCCSALSSALSSPHSRLTELNLSNNNNMEDSGVDQLCEGLRSENCKLEKLNLSYCGLTSRCCSALSSALSAPHSRLTELNLSYNINMEDSGLDQLCEGLRSENCKLEKLNLYQCHLTSKSCSALSSALSSPHSRLTELDLSFNDNIGDSGVDQLCEGLRSENCKLEKLSLTWCGLTSRCCSALSSALSSPHSRLTELNLSYNNMEDSGVDQLCRGLRSENCKLEKLNLSHCGLTSRCCSALSSALSSPHSQLTELDLRGNNMEDSGVDQLCEGLRSENCKLEKLNLSWCYLTSRCCSALSSALSAPHSRLTELKLSDNNMEDSGVDQLCEGLRSENCKLEKLTLSECRLTSRCCSALSSALSAPHSRLTELDLSKNNMEDSGVDQLCEGLRSENCKLEKLNLFRCGLTSRCCSALCSALSSLHSRLTELNLRYNNMEDSGVDQLCEGLRSENCKLEKLNLSDCRLTSRCCSALSSALCAPHLRLTELNLSSNNMEDSGVDQLCEGLRSENCKLEKLDLSSCHLTSRCSSALSSALSAPHSRLTELNLSDNINMEDSGVDQLCEGLKSENCKLEKLNLHDCGLTSRCSSSLSSVFSSPHSQLTELHLNFNKLGDLGAHQLCEGLRTANCKLETLWLVDNEISESEMKNLRSLQEELNRTGWQVDIKI
ncbi:NACHT, LRR and PYD domains-containing protein 3-like isoform X9 [Erpetoichthys calabaricus]|uniref:NACHT, LRR and PYD domains-containing protein 3-like isoform X9 n=1 Tax=Erpetoichthys calabaricus TaxID=27687 RepID=UPI002234CB03|nr:NACHT, LRR and PYD domains-containing protein 3-like isoform X9 [Erpetoichthys calabaricus]